MMPGKFSLKGRLSTRWHNSFLKAVDFDRWDHIPEAIIQYQRFVLIKASNFDIIICKTVTVVDIV